MSVDAPVLELSDATVIKDGRPVLDRLTLRIARGEHTAIIGPNGAGKSLLVSLLTQEQRALAPSNGTPPVRVFGRHNWDLFELRSQLGIISTGLHQHFVLGNSEGSITAEAAVLSAFLSSYGVLRYGTITAGMRERTAAALEAAGASHLAPRTLDEMSSGEARRVLLARALVTSPRALVLDEPTTGLDPVARQSFMEIVRRLARSGTTVVLITHHIEEIIPEIERVILIRDGRIMADGPTAVISPATGCQSCSAARSRLKHQGTITTHGQGSIEPIMSIRGVLVPMLVERFKDRGLQLGEPPDPIAVFPGIHPEVGEIRISDSQTSADLAVGNIVYDHFFNPYDEERGTDKAVEGIANDVVRFLEELFADRLLMWRSVDGRTRGWRERGEAGHLAPLVIDDREYLTYLWSGPLGIWRATPVILARGSIQDDREYEIVVQRVNNDGPDRLQVSDRDALKRIAERGTNGKGGKAARRDRSQQGQQMRRLPI